MERVENDGSISETFNEGHMTVEGKDAYCIDINTGFKNGYKTRRVRTLTVSTSTQALRMDIRPEG